MELGAHVWLRSDTSQWGWVPAMITKKEEGTLGGVKVIHLTLNDDTDSLDSTLMTSLFSSMENQDILQTPPKGGLERPANHRGRSADYYADVDPFEVVLTVDPEALKSADHDDIKLRNLPRSFQLSGEDPEAGVIASPSTHQDDDVVGGVDDLIGLTHLHEPAILHALRLRYDSDIIYTSTGPILIAVNPFKPMGLYSDDMMEQYRVQGENVFNGSSPSVSATYTPFKRSKNHQRKSASSQRLPPHAYQTADDAYRAMMRGIENAVLMGGAGRGIKNNPRSMRRGESLQSQYDTPTNQSILVSGESGAGKTVTTKIVLNYFAMLSKKKTEFESDSRHSSPMTPRHRSANESAYLDEDVSIEQQVLQSNPILESFGNARTIRNDNSSRFGKYIDIRFTPSGKLSGANIETYLLEKVRLIHPSTGERNYHVFYQFLASATATEREQFFFGNMGIGDFKLLNQTGTFDRRDGVCDEDNHQEMLDAMITIGFAPTTIQSLMRLVIAILFAGNMTFTKHIHNHDESCTLDETDASLAAASLLGVSFEDLSAALTTRVILAGNEIVHKSLSIEHATKSCEALMSALYGAAFDFIVEKVNESIVNDEVVDGGIATIGVLDIFGFETFNVNNYEQLCINYTNEALQQQFNKYVFKLEQQEYEREGILWKFISFPDNQDVLDLIDQKHTGILPLLDEQCIVPKSTDQKFTRYLYSRCANNDRFSASSAQRVDHKFSVEHYAGPVEYTTDSWLEKNKDQLPAASVEILSSSDFELISVINKYVRTEERQGRGTIATKSVGAQFSAQLRTLRSRIDTTTPHYIRCLKPNDELVPNRFDPKNIVEQLRCGGVLEAVRVSRAGYPTRYPHDVFLARYYILGGTSDDCSFSPIHPGGNTLTHQEAILKKLVAKIAFDVWEADHRMMVNLLEAERARQEENTPQYKKNPNARANEEKNRNLSILNGPLSLAKEGSFLSPEDKRKKIFSSKKTAAIAMKTLSSKKSDRHNVARPETEAEFLSLDFSSRCAVAGLQLGRTKVFLRREAFDRIESMRSNKFYSSAASIQALVRGKQTRRRYLLLKHSALIIQSIARMRLGARRTKMLRLSHYATVIQSFWRMVSTRFLVYQTYLEMNSAACIIQQSYLSYRRSKNNYPMMAPEPSVDTTASTSNRDTDNLAIMTSHRSIPAEPVQSKEMIPHHGDGFSRAVALAENDDISNQTNELYHQIQEENWAMVENILDKNPELAEVVEPTSGELPLHIISRHAGAWTLLIDMVLVLYPKALIHRDRMGALPIHHAAAHDNLAALEIIYSAYKEGINDVDSKGRLPIHVASEFDAVEAVKFLLAKAPEGAYTMIHRPANSAGGGLPLHIACRNYASIGVITALLAENFASAKRSDENGDLPLHLLLRCGEAVDQVVVKTLLTCFSSAVSRTDMNGDLPLSIALKHQCKPAVVNTLLMQFPDAAGVLNGDGHSPLFLAFQHNADDRTILGLLNHAPELSTAVDKKTGMLPIQVATAHEHSHFIVHNLIKRDMPIDLKEKVRAQLLPHHYSWNHLVCNTDDMYHQVVSKVLQQCTQPQVLALAHVEGEDGKIALASASPVCKYELRVMLRLFNTLEVVNQRPAYTNPVSDTQIFYALRYEPPPQQSGAFTILHEDKKDETSDYIEDWDDSSHLSGLSKNSVRSSMTSRSQQTIEEKLRHIKKEKGQQVIAKLTSRSDVVERELKVRKEFHLSRHYVPAIISVHHTVQHAAYSEAMAEPGYCITMEGADTTAENLMLDMRKSGKVFPAKALKRIGISLLHMHEHGIVHCDFGTHNIGKFGSRWKLLGVGGSVAIGDPTDPDRGFYHPPEAVVVESKRAPLGKKAVSATVVSIPANTTYDIWAYGVVAYEAIAGLPLSPYACRGKRAMSQVEVGKIGRWDENSLKKALKHVDEENGMARDLIKMLLHHDPEKRVNSMRDVLEHPFFGGGADERKSRRSGESVTSGSRRISSQKESSSRVARHSAPSQLPSRSKLTGTSSTSSLKSARPEIDRAFNDENIANGSYGPHSGKGKSFRSVHEGEGLGPSKGGKPTKSFHGLRSIRTKKKQGHNRQHV